MFLCEAAEAESIQVIDLASIHDVHGLERWLRAALARIRPHDRPDTMREVQTLAQNWPGLSPAEHAAILSVLRRVAEEQCKAAGLEAVWASAEFEAAQVVEAAAVLNASWSAAGPEVAVAAPFVGELEEAVAKAQDMDYRPPIAPPSSAPPRSCGAAALGEAVKDGVEEGERLGDEGIDESDNAVSQGDRSKPCGESSEDQPRTSRPRPSPY